MSKAITASLTNGSPWTRPLSNKVPEVSLPFWVVTILATTLGAIAADSLSAHLGLGVGVGMSATTAIMGLVVAGALIWQLSLGRYVPGSYWLTVVLVAVLGTLVSDDLVENLSLSPWATAGVFCSALAMGFMVWRGSEHTVSVHSVLTRRREVWYWFVVLSAFSLGTTIDDLVSEELALGHAATGVVFGALLALVAFVHHSLRLSAIATFWTAYVVTRPMSSLLGDVMTATPSNGGLGLGTVVASALLLTAMLGMAGLFAARARHTARMRSGAGQVTSPIVRP